MATIVRKSEITRGYGTKERPVTQEVWNKETFFPDHVSLHIDGTIEPDSRRFDHNIYIDPAIAALEQEHVWEKSWLYIGRDEDLPNVGDRMPVNVGRRSYMIVHASPDEYKAYYNSCPHRGTELCSQKENAASIRCPYHGWEWQNGGKLKRIPSHWDFKEITPNNGGLPEVRLERWGGFLFINADKEAPSLQDALGLIPDHFKEFDYANRYTYGHFRREMDCNWKVAQEAFQEAYHLYATHPEAVPFAGDAQGKYDVWETKGSYIGRNSTYSAIPSAHAPADTDPVASAQMFLQTTGDWHYPGYPVTVLDPDKDLRAQVADWIRDAYRAKHGKDTELPDAILLDSLLYFFYPHCCFWLSEAVPFTYQFWPHATDPNKSYFEVRMLYPVGEGEARPAAAPRVDIGPDESIFATMQESFGFLAYIFDQDCSNLPRVQRGAHSANIENPTTFLGAYQESIIQQWNKVILAAIEEGQARKRA
ncbi:Rieske [2Fe-2S] domain-containing protein [Sphingobium sp. AP50]|uniref:aromatic ring-hydroxylating oxygenase subunit alpha n=1 Tax=Sphingobium sp. AP50 TaxID=1884369 RepID=UPI0008B0C533|nr:aromatic ring-hydroxylating dioxygenase subunit alpha [Sphingobium sp. AP50]SEJ18429.1 Rieske [2Fe-2S] domain-containing protein [Sphingobium sp. AP50]